MTSDKISFAVEGSFRKAFALAVVICSLFFFVFSLAEDAAATVKPPVHVRLKTDWVPKKRGPPIQIATKGELINITIEISSGTDIATANFDLILSEGWEFVDGDKSWQGKLMKGQKISLKATVRAISYSFGIIRGRVYLPEAHATLEGMLDLRSPEATDKGYRVGADSELPSRVPEAGTGRKVPPLAPEGSKGGI
jgi:hypothetical protein